MSEFLDNLKKSVDDGIFNSEAAKKINDISKAVNVLANNNSNEDIINNVNKRIENIEIQPIDNKTALEKNIEAEKYALKLQHESDLLKIKASVLNSETKIIDDVVELVSNCKSYLLKLNENDLEMKEFLISFVEKYRIS